MFKHKCINCPVAESTDKVFQKKACTACCTPSEETKKQMEETLGIVRKLATSARDKIDKIIIDLLNK